MSEWLKILIGLIGIAIPTFVCYQFAVFTKSGISSKEIFIVILIVSIAYLLGDAMTRKD